MTVDALAQVGINWSDERVLARLLQWRRELGISRIGDITGLDRIGIPVMQVTRPRSRSNAVSQGKGLLPVTAAISALSESCETFFAERLDRFNTIKARAIDLSIGAELAQHVRLGVSPDWTERQIRWTEAQSLFSGEMRPVPFEMVHAAYDLPSGAREGIFETSSTGLAASFIEEDAFVHGILECLERDAIVRAERMHGFFQRHRIDTATILDTGLQDLLEGLKGRGMLVGLWQAPSFSGVQVIWCQVMERDLISPILPFPADGTAASTDPVCAARQAILEAAQCRLTAISGARDDMPPEAYPKLQVWDGAAAHRHLLEQGPRPIDFRHLMETAPVADALPVLLTLIERSGISDVLLVRIDTSPFQDIHVIKAVIPDCRPLLHG
ncbi:MAG: YcaO-like family protein [Proteobacteria bacterium]|nr:YcaO-like family protein [Pseudomonadota bacterium]